MKQFVILMLGVLIVSCATPPRVAPEPDAEMERVSGVPLIELQRGKEVYNTQCTRCHVPMLPDEVSEGDWHVVVPGMSWNAGIDKADEEALLSYILAAKQMP